MCMYMCMCISFPMSANTIFRHFDSEQRNIHEIIKLVKNAIVSLIIICYRNFCLPIVNEPLAIFNYFSLQFEPYVQEGNEAMVHHLIIHECHGKFNESFFGPGFDCNHTANMPLNQCYSSSVVAVWAVGGEVCAVLLALKSILDKIAKFLFRFLSF